MSTDPVVLNTTGGVQPDIFDDLGTGASVISVSNDVSGALEIPLNQAGVSAIQNGTVFSVGMRVLDGDGARDHYIFGSASPEPNPFVHELRITTVPEPSSTLLLAVALLVALLFQSWRWRVAH